MRFFLEDVEAFLRRHPEVSPTRFGSDSIGDPGLVRQLRRTDKPRRPRIDTVQTIVEWMSAYERDHPAGDAVSQQAAE